MSSIEELAKKLDYTEYTLCLKEIYQQMSQLLLSHQLIARYHENYDEGNEVITEKENKGLYSLMIKNRKEFNLYIQEQITKFFEGTKNFFLNLSIKELFDVLRLTGKFLEISIEFVFSSKTKILYDTVFGLTQRYIKDFFQSQKHSLIESLENE